MDRLADADPARGRQSAPLRRAGLLLAVQGVALSVLGLGYAVSGVVGQPESRVATVLAGLFALVVGAGLTYAGRGLGAARGWAVAPALLTQVFLLVIGSSLWKGGVYAAAAALLLPAAGVLGLLVTRQARGDLQQGPGPPREGGRA